MNLLKVITIGLVALATTIGLYLPVHGKEQLDMAGFLEAANAQAENGGTIIALIGSAGDAFSWSNTVLEGRGDAPLYCAHNKLGLTNGQYLDILRGQIESHPELRVMEWRSWPLLLLKGLQEAFPCK